MIAKSYISQNLQAIDRLYQKARTPQTGFFYSKLAILELGGWVEMSMDGIILKHAKRKLRDPTSISKVKEVVKKTYGFDYEQHFKRMLLAIFGYAGWEAFDKKVDAAKMQAMSAALVGLKQHRDKEAHEYTKGTTRTLDAPSVTKAKFLVIHTGLIEIERALNRL